MKPIEEAERALNRGDQEEARATILRALVAAPDDALLWNALGMIDLTSGALVEARTELEKSVSLCASETNLMNLSHAYRALHDIDGEEKALLRLLELNPFDWDALMNLGGLFADDRKDAHRALSLFKRAHEIKRTSDSAYNIALMEEKIGHQENALKWYLEGLKLPSPSEDLYVMSGLALEARAPRKAMRVFKKGLRTYPKSALLSYDIACFYLARGKKARADKWFEKAFAQDARYRDYYKQDMEVIALRAKEND